MDTFDIVLLTIYCVLAFFGILFIIIMKYHDFKEAKELKEDEKEQRLRNFSSDISDNFRFIRKLEKELMLIDCRVCSLESKTKRGKSKK